VVDTFLTAELEVVLVFLGDYSISNPDGNKKLFLFFLLKGLLKILTVGALYPVSDALKRTTGRYQPVPYNYPTRS
jgi:hypothetical protein